MSTFLEQIDSLQASLNGLRVETTRELLHLTDQARLATTSRQESQIDQQAQSLVQQSNQCLAKVKQTLERLQRETENGTLSDSECRYVRRRLYSTSCDGNLVPLTIPSSP